MMDRFAYGSTQGWGLAPAAKLMPSQNTILIDSGDLRYYFMNITMKTNFFFYERNLPVIGRNMFKILLLLKIQLAETTEQAIQLAHTYCEAHANLNVS